MIDSEPLGKDMFAPANISALLRARVEAPPDKIFLVSEDGARRFTYAEFERAANETALMLPSHGIEKGDVVSLLMPNSAEYSVAYFACWQLRALAGPVNSLLKEPGFE